MQPSRAFAVFCEGMGQGLPSKKRATGSDCGCTRGKWYLRARGCAGSGCESCRRSCGSFGRRPTARNAGFAKNWRPRARSQRFGRASWPASGRRSPTGRTPTATGCAKRLCATSACCTRTRRLASRSPRSRRRAKSGIAGSRWTPRFPSMAASFFSFRDWQLLSCLSRASKIGSSHRLRPGFGKGK